MENELKLKVSEDQELVLQTDFEGDEVKNFKLVLREKNFKITLGGFEFDFFLSPSSLNGNLGFTIARKGDLEDDDGPAVDVFVDQDLNVRSI